MEVEASAAWSGPSEHKVALVKEPVMGSQRFKDRSVGGGPNHYGT